MLTTAITIFIHYFLTMLIHIKIFNINSSSRLNITYKNTITDIGTITSSQNNDALCFVSSTPISSSNNYNYNHSLITSIHTRSYIFPRNGLLDEVDDDSFSGEVLNSALLTSDDEIW